MLLIHCLSLLPLNTCAFQLPHYRARVQSMPLRREKQGRTREKEDFSLPFRRAQTGLPEPALTPSPARAPLPIRIPKSHPLPLLPLQPFPPQPLSLLLVTFPLIPSPCRVCFQGFPTVNFVASPGGEGITIPWGINSTTSPGHPRVVGDVNPTPKVSLPRTRPAPSAQRSQPLPHGVFISEIRAEITPPQISQLVSVLNCTFGPPSTEGTI